MTASRRFASVLAVVLAACVPTPGGRAAPSPDAEGPSATAAGDASAAAPSPSTGPLASPSFVRPTPNPSPAFLVYEVRPGDSLTSVARLFGTTARSIAFWNRARYPSLDPDSRAYQPDRIKIGWTLLLIPTEVVAEDELPDPAPTSAPGSAPPAASSSPS